MTQEAHETLIDKAAERGVPSLVWRAGQARQFEMMQAAAGQRLTADCRVLVNGCGLGMHNRAFLAHTPYVYGLDIEMGRVWEAYQNQVPLLVVANGEALPYAADSFDLVLSHETLEHVGDDALYAAEMIRVLRPGGRAIIFCPNRLYPFETHGHYWRGKYHFGNTPLINYLPDPWRNQLAPHVRAYTAQGLQRLFLNLPARVISHTQIFPGYDNIVYRRPRLGQLLRRITYTLEQTPLRLFGMSHLLVLEKG